jgi:hypothetical protein
VVVAAGAKPALGIVKPLGLFVGSPAYGSFVSGVVDVIGFKTTSGDPSATVKSYTPSNLLETNAPFVIQTNDEFLKPLAFAECLGQALLTGTNQDLGVYAIPLTSSPPRPRRASMQHSGQMVQFEPYTSTVLAPFSQGDAYELTAFTLGGTRSDPELVPRSAPEWSPPRDLRPEIVATRTPLPVKCPP